jgi:hypothetical protein
MAKAKTWAQERAKAIEMELRANWGPGWKRIGPELQGALIAEKVLMLVLSQFGEQYKPAMDMARSVLQASAHQDWKDAA